MRVQEIVAVQIGTMIVNDPRLIRAAIELKQDIRLYDRETMRFMSGLDLGPTWGQLAAGPTLFCIDENGDPQSANYVETLNRGDDNGPEQPNNG